MENTHAGTGDNSVTDSSDEVEEPNVDDTELSDDEEEASIEDVFSTDEDERIEAALDFVEDEENPATLGGLLDFVREDEDSDLDESKVRERARERGLIEGPDE